MDVTALHLEVRNALELADELSRHEHSLGQTTLTGTLRSLGTSLSSIEKDLGQSHEHPIPTELAVVESTRRSVDSLHARRGDMPLYLRRRVDELVASGRRVVFGLAHPNESVPSKPLLGGTLPLQRVVSQDVHSILDYVAAFACATTAIFASTKRAKIAGSALAASMAGTAATSDARLAAVRKIPIETHAAIDYGWGLAAVLAPFVFGYAKKDPLASTIQIASGLLTLAVSLVTDYRAQDGIAAPRRSLGGPEAGRARIQTSPTRIPQASRPLEGLSSGPTNWRPESLDET